MYQHPQTHIQVHEQRHADLVRQARQGELAARLAAEQRAEGRSFFARFRRARGERASAEGRPAASAG